jgi:hypothetical protein
MGYFAKMGLKSLAAPWYSPSFAPALFKEKEEAVWVVFFV